MGFFSNEIKTMEDLHLHTLQDIYYAEKQITKALPDMIEKATNRELIAGFKTHLTETETQVQRLEQVFTLLSQKPKQVTCPAIDGILKEANEISSEIEDKSVLDAALAAAAQAVEHYEITRYGTLIAWSEQMGLTEVVKLLQQTLEEEKATDLKLSKLAITQVNLRAAS